MRQADQEILAARFQISARDGRGDRRALANWLNCLRNLRNICAHYGRVWNRTFDVLIDVPGLTLGFPEDWRSDSIWDRGFVLDAAPMLAAGLLDRAECQTAPQTRAALTAAEARPSETSRTPEQQAGAKKGAQKALLRTYQHYKVVIEVDLGQTKYYPALQFRDGKIIDALAEVNQALARRCVDIDPARVSAAQLDWWQTPYPDLPKSADGKDRSPLDLLESVPESEFTTIIDDSGALRGFVSPER